MANAVFFQSIKLLMPLMAPSRRLMANKISEVPKIWLAEKLGQVGRRFFCRVNGFCHCTTMGKTCVSGGEAVCFWLKQFVSDCSNHCAHCTRLYGEDNYGRLFAARLVDCSFVG